MLSLVSFSAVLLTALYWVRHHLRELESSQQRRRCREMSWDVEASTNGPCRSQQVQSGAASASGTKSRGDEVILNWRVSMSLNHKTAIALATLTITFELLLSYSCETTWYPWPQYFQHLQGLVPRDAARLLLRRAQRPLRWGEIQRCAAGIFGEMV